jgi:type II secretory pathway pseudopilin PulG
MTSADVDHARAVSRKAGFTLAEVVISTAIILMTLGGVIYGYVKTTDRAEWSAYSLAAQSLALQGVEQTRAAKWDPQAWPPIDQLGTTNFVQVEQLDVPENGSPVLATNYISVTLVSSNPPLKQLRADCVWELRHRPANSRGPFTNTAITLRAADQ